MSWYSGEYTNWEAPGFELQQQGDRYVAGFNANLTASNASVIKAADISAVGYAIGPITSNYVTPAMGAAGTEIYGVIPKGGSQDWPNPKLLDSATAGPGYVYTTNSTGSEYQVKRQIFRVANQIGARFEVAYVDNSDSSPSVGHRVVCAGSGSVEKAPILASSVNIGAGRIFSNWVVIALDTTNKYCIIEKVG